MAPGKYTGLTRRLLFPYLSADEALPPVLQARTHGTQELEMELYEFIALSLRAFVQPWWSKLSKHDRDFLPHVTQIIIHVIQNLEHKLRYENIDLSRTIFQEAPALVTQHFVDFRNAQSKLSTSYANGGTAPIAEVFHAVQAHMALHSDGSVEETYIRLCVEHVLKECLPEEDWNAEVERAIVREVIVRLLIDVLFERLVQPWFWMKVLLDLTGPPHTAKGSFRIINNTEPKRRYTCCGMLVVLLMWIQSLAGQALSLIAFGRWFYHLFPLVDTKSSSDARALQEMSLFRPLVILLSEALTLRRRHASSAILSTVLGINDLSVPLVNQLIRYAFKAYTQPLMIAKIVSLVKNTVFSKDGYPAPRPEDPTTEEQAFIRIQLESRLCEMVDSSLVASLVLGQSQPQRHRTIQDCMEPLCNAPCNAHLVLFLLDLVLLGVFPSLGQFPLGEQTMQEGVERKPSLSEDPTTSG